MPVETEPPYTHHFEGGAPGEFGATPPEEIPVPEPPPQQPEIQPEFVEERPPPFPWPPPKASAFQVLPRKLLVGEKETVRLKDVNTTPIVHLNTVVTRIGVIIRTDGLL